MDRLRVIVPVLALAIVSSLGFVSCGRGDPEKIRQNLHLPKPGYVADAGRGKTLYTENCVSCHGAHGQGTTQGPPLVHVTYEPNHHPDMAFHLAVKNGVRQHHWNFGNMPSIKDVSPENVADIVKYIRGEQERAGIN